MVVKPNNMEKQVRSELKGGKGDIHFLNCVSKDTIPNCRLLSYMTIPPEGSIGEHEHVEETECYVIKSGKGVVIDNGKKIDISAGDVVITGNGDIHSVIRIAGIKGSRYRTFILWYGNWIGSYFKKNQ